MLIVEDNQTARMALEKLLAAQGFLVQSAATLRAAREGLNGHACVILDLDLPDGNGIDLLKKIRNEHLPVKVLIATASVDPWMLNEVRKLQPDTLLFKPLDTRRLVDLLRSLCGNPTRAAESGIAASAHAH